MFQDSGKKTGCLLPLHLLQEFGQLPTLSLLGLLKNTTRSDGLRRDQRETINSIDATYTN